MVWDWEMIRAKAKIVFAKVAQLIVFQLACVYLLTCTVARKPVGPKIYVDFVHYCFQWLPAKDAGKQPLNARAKAADHRLPQRDDEEQRSVVSDEQAKN